MPISLLEQKKKHKFLLLIFAGIVLLALIILWTGFFRKPSAPSSLPPEATMLPSQKINIDWQVLKNPILETLEPLEEIAPLKGNPGRKNPFLPY